MLKVHFIHAEKELIHHRRHKNLKFILFFSSVFCVLFVVQNLPILRFHFSFSDRGGVTWSEGGAVTEL